ncbi:hypothetical protein GALL_120680 [mine drainage metagenome]|uniref:Uncharacterized protein n=1 Tax=mine drainage metagenome TaxID=410659 RepID=A0A1J5SDC2_9ZZZZ
MPGALHFLNPVSRILYPRSYVNNGRSVEDSTIESNFDT